MVVTYQTKNNTYAKFSLSNCKNFHAQSTQGNHLSKKYPLLHETEKLFEEWKNNLKSSLQRHNNRDLQMLECYISMFNILSIPIISVKRKITFREPEIPKRIFEGFDPWLRVTKHPNEIKIKEKHNDRLYIQ